MTAVQQSAAPHPAVRQRIDWIDTAKGLCMILVIVGHTLPYGNLMRNFIFSFHMPAFFFLTGYIRPAARIPGRFLPAGSGRTLLH